MTTQLISRDFHGATIRQRSTDGYLDATAMCKATGKRLNNYLRNKTTKEFLTELSNFLNIPIEIPVALISVTEQNQLLIQIVKGGTPENQGTWVHPYVSINLAQWCSPKFAVMVTGWVFELLTKGSVTLEPTGPTQEIAAYAKVNSDMLDSFGITGNAKQISLNNSIKEKFGYDALQAWNIESQTSEVQQALLIPTEIAKRVGLKSARPVNVKLIDLGLQTKHRDDKKRLYYELTEDGLKHAQYQDTSKRHNSGEPVRAIKWYESVLALF
jgi:hypothetical protein